MAQTRSYQLVVTLLPDSAEHPVEIPEDFLRAFEQVRASLLTGATAGATVLRVPHSHQGDSDLATYQLGWRISEA